MRVHETKEPHGLLANDLLDLIECSECVSVTHSIEPPGTPLICSGCKKELFYRPWCEW